MTPTNRLATLGLGLALAAGCRNQGRSLMVEATEAGVIDAAVDSAPVAVDALSFRFPDAPPPLDFGPDSPGPHCWQYAMHELLVVCFGDDPAPYAQYLIPRDGGYPTGQCPGEKNFYFTAQGEGCVWAGCGPADPADRDGGPVDAEAGADADSARCCFWVTRACGV
jgi:hypothetical protein